MPDAEAIVIDASVAINLNATRRAADIVAALPYRVLVTTNVVTELRDTGRRGRDDAAMLGNLVGAGLVRRMVLPDAVLDDYLELVSGGAMTSLDDGEAATIALAKSMDAIAGLDEHKARALCVRTVPALRLVSSVDLLLSADVGAALGLHGQVEVVYAALREARMQVRNERLVDVVDLIGADRARTCPSLPASARGGL